MPYTPGESFLVFPKPNIDYRNDDDLDDSVEMVHVPDHWSITGLADYISHRDYIDLANRVYNEFKTLDLIKVQLLKDNPQWRDVGVNLESLSIGMQQLYNYYLSICALYSFFEKIVQDISGEYLSKEAAVTIIEFMRTYSRDFATESQQTTY